MHQNQICKNDFIGKTFYTVIDNKEYENKIKNCKMGKLSLPKLTDSKNNIMGYYCCDIENVVEWHRIFPNGLVYNVIIPSEAVTVFKCSNKYITNHMIISDPLKYSEWVQKQKDNNMIITDEKKYDNVPYKWYCLKHIDNQSKELCVQALEHDYKALQYIKDPSKYPEILDIAIQINGLSLRYIKNPTNEQCIQAVTQNGTALQYIENQTFEQCFVAIKQTPLALKYVIVQTYDLCLHVVKQHGYMLRYVGIDLITPYLCDIAVKQNPNALRFVPPNFQTDEMCENIVTICPLALQYVAKITMQICVIACEKNGMAIKYCDREYQTVELCLIAVKQNGLALKYIDPLMQIPQICLEAVIQNSLALQYVNKKK